MLYKLLMLTVLMTAEPLPHDLVLQGSLAFGWASHQDRYRVHWPCLFTSIASTGTQ
jgi:hypothetical protein